MSLSMTGVELTQEVANRVVALVATKYTGDLVKTYTNLDKDRLAVQIGCVMVGEVVAHKVRPVTDKLVSGTIQGFRNKKAARKTKKDEPKIETT